MNLDTNLIPAGEKCPCGWINRMPFCESEDDDE